MKQIIQIVSGILLIAAVACKHSKKGNHSEQQAETIQEIYTCSMHPEIIRDKAGTCPVCGMNLVKKAGSGKKSVEIDLEMLLANLLKYYTINFLTQ